MNEMCQYWSKLFTLGLLETVDREFKHKCPIIALLRANTKSYQVDLFSPYTSVLLPPASLMFSTTTGSYVWPQLLK